MSRSSEGTGVDDTSLAKLVEMGFTLEMARNALIISRGDMGEATQLLISSHEW